MESPGAGVVPRSCRCDQSAVQRSRRTPRYRYNGLKWQITKLVDIGRDGDLDQQRQMYYSANWQLLEEDINDDYPSSTDPTRRVQYIWGLRYIDDLICSRAKNLPSGGYTTRYHLTDAQFSAVALLSSSGTLLERVAYDPYGEARHQWPGDLDGDGAVTTTEITAIYNIGRGSNNAIGEVNYDVEADLNRDGVVNATDYQMVNGASAKSALPKGDLSAPGIGNIIGYAGYIFNGETITATTGAMYTVRHRHYAPDLGRWIERDPIGYMDGMSLYEYVQSAPADGVDPYGLQRCYSGEVAFKKFGGGFSKPKVGSVSFGVWGVAFTGTIDLEVAGQVCLKTCGECPLREDWAGSLSISIAGSFAGTAFFGWGVPAGPVQAVLGAEITGKASGHATASISLDYCDGYFSATPLEGKVSGSLDVGGVAYARGKVFGREFKLFEARLMGGGYFTCDFPSFTNCCGGFRIYFQACFWNRCYTATVLDINNCP